MLPDLLKKYNINSNNNANQNNTETQTRISSSSALPDVLSKYNTNSQKVTTPTPIVANPVRQETISQAPVDTRKEDTLLARIGRIVLPHSLETAFGISEEQRKPAELSQADTVRMVGTAQTNELMAKNPEKVSNLEYLRRGLSFGNELDPTNLIKGYKADVSVTDLPEPTTVPQKVAQAVGGLITMSVALPLIEAGVGSLIGSSAQGAKLLETLKTASEVNPWTVGYGLDIAKAGAEGGLFGLITNNRQSVAKNVIDTAGTFAAFSAIAYPVAQFFKPIIQSVGKMEINNPNLKNILNDPAVTQPTISKTLWFKNPKDETQLLKVTANGMEFTTKQAGEIVEGGTYVKDIPTLTSVDIEAFQTKPSVYQNLKEWIGGKLPKKNVEFTVGDTMPNNAKVDINAVETPNITNYNTAITDISNYKPSDIRTNLLNLDKELQTIRNAGNMANESALIGKINATRDAFNSYNEANKETVIYVPSEKPNSSLATVEVVKYNDGKYIYSIDANLTNAGIGSPFSSKVYNSKEEATNAGIADIKRFLDHERENATPSELQQIKKIESAIGITSKTENKPVVGSNINIQEDLAPLFSENTTNDVATIQELKNAINEGKTILRANTFNGNKLTLEERGMIAKAVANAQAKIGVEDKGGYKIQEISSDTIFNSNINPTKNDLTKEGLKKWNILVKRGEAKFENNRFSMIKKEPRFAKVNQKEVVKEAIKETPKSIKQISEETKILEPNVRRILGVGAKEGKFDRVDKGVYILKKGNEDIAYIQTGDAVTSLPKLAKDGLKADMVFLDIPYDTPAVKGGSRGVNYNLISVSDFGTILDAVKQIARKENTPVIHMFSQAESGMKAMQKYNDLIIAKGFIPVGRGEYQKTYKNDKPVAFPTVNGSMVTKPEGILVFTQSGKLDKELGNLNFRLVRPSGYQTEKPAEMLKKMIEMTTEQGDIVLDPFAGSGVTGSEAIKAGRKAVLIEKNPQVVENIIAPRVKQAIIDTDALNTEIKPIQAEIGLGENKDGMLTTKELEKNGEAIKILNEDIATEGKAFVESQNKKPTKVNNSKSFASMDKFRETMEPTERAIDAVNPIEFPELVKLARQLTGDFPKVKLPRFRPSMGGNPLGVFTPIGDGKITLNPDLFKEGNEQQAAKTLAHEIGHLIDYLPEHTMARGNILGRLAVLKNFGKDFYPEIGGTRSNTEMKRELWALSKYWKPVDEATAPQGFLEYRKSPPEIYADFISVLFNDPKLAQNMAPESYNTFFNRLDQKPEVKQAYFELQDLLSGSTEELMKARQDDIRAGFARGEDLQAGFKAKKENKISHFWERLRQQLDDKNYPILKKQQQAEANGHVFTEAENPKFVLQEQSLADNENFVLVDKIDSEIVKPLEKAGMVIEDVGEYLLLDRIINERQNIANPFGFNTKNAPKQVEYLKKTIGDSNFKLLQQKVQEFHDLVYKSVEEAVKVGSYNKEIFDTKIAPNKNHYASFQVIDYMQDYMPATIKGQVGTLKEVANPFVSTILKTIALNRLNAFQRAKNATISMLKENFADEISPSKSITTDGKLRIFKPAKDRGTIELLEDGKINSYDVDPYIADSFNKMKVGDLNMLVSLLDKFNNKLFKPLVTTYNLGFALAFNPIRDFKRNYKLIPNATVFNLLKAYFNALPEAVKYAKGQLDTFTRELVDSKAINAPVNDYNYDVRDDELGNILKKYGLIQEDKPLENKTLEIVRKKILKPVVQVLEGIRFIANTFEVVSKIGGAKLRIQGGESGKQLAYNVRNFTGTPNYKVRGNQTATTNAIFVFSNIMKEGLKADFKIASDPKTRSGYWWKTAKIDLLPKFLMFLAGAGVLGAGIKQWFDKVSEYDKSNYLIIPLGTNDAGKAIYMRIPHDENGRLISTLFWKMANFAKDQKLNELQDIFALGAGQLPSVSPAITILGNWSQYLSGRNPHNAFKGKTLIDDTTWQAGGSAALKKMVQWTTNNLGFSKFATYDTSKNTGIETFMQVAPFFSSVVKISDYGLAEKTKEVSAEAIQKKAKQTLLERDVVQKYVTEATKDGKLSMFSVTKYGNQAVKEILGHMPQSKEEQDRADRIITRFKVSTKKNLASDPRYVNLLYATSNDEKKAILKSIKTDSTTEQWDKIRNDLLQLKIVTPAVFYGVK